MERSKKYNMSKAIAQANLLPPPFRKGSLVQDAQLGRVGRVTKASRRFIHVDYPNALHFMSLEIVYHRFSVHRRLRHYRGDQTVGEEDQGIRSGGDYP